MNKKPTLTESNAYAPPESLWQFIKASAEEKELDSIKSRIGESLIETNIDLHNEVDSLLEIWREFRAETSMKLNRSNQLKTSYSSLPEPPNIRETIKKEIFFFVKQMREQYKTEDAFCKQIINNKHNLTVINYALNQTKTSDALTYNLKQSRNSPADQRGVFERPPSSINVHGAETPAVHVNHRNSTSSSMASGRESSRRSYTSMSSRSNCRKESILTSDLPNNDRIDENSLELIIDEDKLNCFQIDDVVDHLRELLQEECDILLKDIEFLYQCIELENEYRENSAKSLSENKEPSLMELKEERKLLESDLNSSHTRNQANISKLPEQISSARSNRSIMSPILMSPAPDKIHRTAVKANHDPRKSSPKLRTPSKVDDANSLNGHQSKSNGALKTPKSSGISTLNITSNLEEKIKSYSRSSNENLVSISHRDKNGFKPRSDSASSRTSLTSLSSSSALSKMSAVQKFRQMVLDYRD